MYESQGVRAGVVVLPKLASSRDNKCSVTGSLLLWGVIGQALILIQQQDKELIDNRILLWEVDAWFVTSYRDYMRYTHMCQLTKML